MKSQPEKKFVVDVILRYEYPYKESEVMFYEDREEYEQDTLAYIQEDWADVFLNSYEPVDQQIRARIVLS